jgi:dynein light chain 1
MPSPLTLLSQATAGKGDVQTSCKQAIDLWRERNNNEDPALAKKVLLIAQLPSIKKMEPTLAVLTACEQLSLSSNSIDRIIPLPTLKSLKILSLGRNQLKKIEKLEDNAATLEELWLSYNQIDKLDGLTGMKKLRVLYLSNNMIKGFDELMKLRELPALEDLLLIGNPFYEGLTKEQRRVEVLKRVPKIKKLDGVVVSDTERDAAMGAAPDAA